MKNILNTTAIIILLAFASCDYPSGARTVDTLPSSNQVWVAQFYSGGVQCDTSSHYTPPDTKSILNRAGVYVADTDVEPYATCDGCECPAYAAMHYALIPESDLARAERIGFRPRPLPWLYIRTQRFNYDCTDTLNFSITNFTRYTAYLPSCGSQIYYSIEIMSNGRWEQFTAINNGPCIDIVPQYVKIHPHQTLRERLPLSSVGNWIDDLYRISMVYHFDNLKSICYAHSNPFRVTCATDTTNLIPRELYGSWNWIKSQGGIAGITITPATAGYTRKVVYHYNLLYESYKNDSLELVSPFSVYDLAESPFGSHLFIHYEALPAYRDQYIYQLTRDTLVLGDNCIDCFVHTYVRRR